MAQRKTDRWLEISLGVLLLALIYVVTDTIREKVVRAGDSAPEFLVTTKSGAKVGPEQFQGKLLMINFWATWCPPCVEETPALNELHRRFHDRGLTILGLSVDKDEKAYEAFVNRFHVGYEVARDPEADISANYGTYKYPETYIIDKDGKVIEKIIGADWSFEELSKRLDALLGRG